MVVTNAAGQPCDQRVIHGAEILDDLLGLQSRVCNLDEDVVATRECKVGGATCALHLRLELGGVLQIGTDWEPSRTSTFIHMTCEHGPTFWTGRTWSRGVYR